MNAQSRRFDFNNLLIMLLIAFAFLAFCAGVAKCDEVDKARLRLREIEAAKSVLDGPTPVPDPISERPEPAIEFERVVQSTVEETYFCFFTKPFCSHCQRMEDDGIEAALKDAGHVVRVVNIDREPHESVSAAPEVWLCDSGGMPIRRWRGYHTAKQILSPFSGDGLCRMYANDHKWSGVAIGDGLILTVAHHEQDDGFFAEFPTSFGSTEYARVSADLIKIDKKADLSVLRYRLPESVTIKPYDLTELAANAIEIHGYFEGQTPKRVKIRKKDKPSAIAGIAIDSYDGFGIASPQFGMSGSPLLTPDKRIAGIQAIGQGSEIGAVTVDTIRTFLADVDRIESDAIASVANAEASPETFAAVVAAHLAESSGRNPQSEEIVYGSLFDFSIDVPESWKSIGSKILTAQELKFPAAGITVDWTGPQRSFVVGPNKLAISPPVKVTLDKWLISYSAALDGVEFKTDLSSVTFLLTGAPDLTVNLK